MTIKPVSQKVFKTNTEELEELFLSHDIDDTWMNSYLKESQIIDIAIATLAHYGNTVTIQEIVEVEELRTDSNYDSSLLRMMTLIYSLWVDKDSITSRDENMLHEPKDAHWKTLMDRKIATLLMQKGTLVSYSASYYGWEDYDEKLNRNAIVALFDLKEDSWREFNGTFASKDSSVTGFTCSIMLKNGIFRNLRYVGDLATIMREIT